MKKIILITMMCAFTSIGYAQTHVRKAIDDMLAKHPEWVVNQGNSENGNTSPTKAGSKTNRIYQLSIPDTTAMNNLLGAFEADKMECYSYIRTSAEYNQATQNRCKASTVTLQNGDRLESHSTEYSFVSLAVVDPEQRSYRTSYILKWYPIKNGRTVATLYILYGPRPNK